MENVTYEQALSVVQALPPEDLHRLWQGLEGNQAPAEHATNGAIHSHSLRESEMRWLREHRSAYIGQWVALDGDRLLSHSEDLGKVFDEARAQGIQVPFTAFIEDRDQPSMGGW
jgi:Family of unknown function (DUF5678)